LHHAWGETQATGMPVKPWPWADTYPIARLLAPAHDVDLVVVAGAAKATLALGPAHHQGSALPGQPGNTVVSAPRDTHFRFLRQLAAGDELIVEIATGQRMHYRVKGPMTAAAEALREPRLAAPTLTLVAGDPLDTPRYIVVATADGATT
jgi:sortase A